MKRINITSTLTIAILLLIYASACNNNKNQKSGDAKDSVSVNNNIKASSKNLTAKDSTKAISGSESNTKDANSNSSTPTVLIYNFHVTNRCPSCIAIEEATTRMLNIYFAAEVKKGQIKRQVLNVDDEANKKISEKYQAFGSGLFVTRVFKGQETTTDLTGTGFKYAKNKEEKFIEILKNQISEYLK